MPSWSASNSCSREEPWRTAWIPAPPTWPNSRCPTCAPLLPPRPPPSSPPRRWPPARPMPGHGARPALARAVPPAAGRQECGPSLQHLDRERLRDLDHRPVVLEQPAAHPHAPLLEAFQVHSCRLELPLRLGGDADGEVASDAAAEI